MKYLGSSKRDVKLLEEASHRFKCIFAIKVITMLGLSGLLDVDTVSFKKCH